MAKFSPKSHWQESTAESRTVFIVTNSVDDGDGLFGTQVRNKIGGENGLGSIP
jgi:hypothetical protein